MWCIVGIGLFTSIGWPNIFSLALDGMGIYKSQVSSLLVMAILGGALLPPLQGRIADYLSMAATNMVCNTHSSFRLSPMRMWPFTVGKAIKSGAPGWLRIETIFIEYGLGVIFFRSRD